MGTSTTQPCENCKRLQAQVRSLEEKLALSEQKTHSLEEQLAAAKKDSTNSSKPPSSDIVKPKPPVAEGIKRSIGGQPGHPKHDRIPFPPEQITYFKTHQLTCCPDCGGPLRTTGNPPIVVQQVDVQKPPITVEQHTFPTFWCDRCHKGHTAPMPIHIQRGGLAGSQLTALIAFMKGACHASFSTIRTFLRDVVRVTISRGQLVKIISKVTEALQKPYEELLHLLPKEPVLNV